MFESVDKLSADNNQKTKFANEKISHFLSFKDEKWVDEHEIRYQIFYYDSYSYFDLNKYKRFLKIKNSIYLSPDNIFSDNKHFDHIKANIFDRRYATTTREFIKCNDCLNIDDETFGIKDKYKCTICGSLNGVKINSNQFKKKHTE